MKQDTLVKALEPSRTGNDPVILTLGIGLGLLPIIYFYGNTILANTKTKPHEAERLGLEIPYYNTGLTMQSIINSQSGQISNEFNSNDSRTFNLSMSTQITDKQSSSHILTLFYVKRAPNNWEVFPRINHKSLEGYEKFGIKFNSDGIPDIKALNIPFDGREFPIDISNMKQLAAPEDFDYTLTGKFLPSAELDALRKVKFRAKM